MNVICQWKLTYLANTLWSLELSDDTCCGTLGNQCTSNFNDTYNDCQKASSNTWLLCLWEVNVDTIHIKWNNIFSYILDSMTMPTTTFYHEGQGSSGLTLLWDTFAFALCDGLLQRTTSDIKFHNMECIHALTSGLKSINNFHMNLVVLNMTPILRIISCQNINIRNI